MKRHFLLSLLSAFSAQCLPTQCQSLALAWSRPNSQSKWAADAVLASVLVLLVAVFLITPMAAATFADTVWVTTAATVEDITKPTITPIILTSGTSPAM